MPAHLMRVRHETRFRGAISQKTAGARAIFPPKVEADARRHRPGPPLARRGRRVRPGRRQDDWFRQDALLGSKPRVDAPRRRPGRVGPHGYALEATLDRSYDTRTLAERTARAAALCGRPDPRPRLRCLRRNFGGSSVAALLRRGRDRRSDLGLVKGRCGHTGVGTPGGTPEHWGYTKNTWVYTPRSLNIVLGL